MQLIQGLPTVFQFLAHIVAGGRKELFVQVSKLLVVIHFADDAFTAPVIKLQDFRSDNFLNGLWHALINLSPSSIRGHIW